MNLYALKAVLTEGVMRMQKGVVKPSRFKAFFCQEVLQNLDKV
jgi:hypothetical protein